MAQGKKEDSAIFRQPSLPPSNDTPHILQGMSDDDSDAGSFLDNDTEDFLPSGLVSGEMKEVLSHYKLRKRDTAKSKPATVLQTSTCTTSSLSRVAAAAI